jgi:L-gulonolactone oxidase
LGELTPVVRSVEWSNWAGTESTRLARVATPRSEAEVVEEVRAAASRDLRVKAIGAGHSFTGVAVTDGLQLRLGALGIVTEITVAVVPAFLLHAVERPESLTDVLAHADVSAEANDHFEFYWFPHTDRVLTKRNNRVPEGTARRPLPAWREKLDDDLLSNRFFELTNRVATRMPRSTRTINAVASRALSERQYTDSSHKVFVTAREVRFMESEWAFPRASLSEVLLELREWVNTHDERISFPVECRVAAADDVWLSTAYERQSCYVAIHKYHRQERGAYFDAFEAIAVNHGGRPHWGKLHTRDADYLRGVYPRFDDFVAVRDRVDPERRFANPYLERVLGR